MYTSFVQFSQTDKNTEVEENPTTFNDLTYPGQYKAFDIPVTPDPECASFEICSGTDIRPNRQQTNRPVFALSLSSFSQSFSLSVEGEREKERKEQEEREERRRRSETRKSQQTQSGKYCCPVVTEPQ